MNVQRPKYERWTMRDEQARSEKDLEEKRGAIANENRPTNIKNHEKKKHLQWSYEVVKDMYHVLQTSCRLWINFLNNVTRIRFLFSFDVFSFHFAVEIIFVPLSLVVSGKWVCVFNGKQINEFTMNGERKKKDSIIFHRSHLMKDEWNENNKKKKYIFSI